jgi:hypothetical protein
MLLELKLVACPVVPLYAVNPVALPPATKMFALLKLVVYVVTLFTVVALIKLADTLAKFSTYPPVITALPLLKFVA